MAILGLHVYAAAPRAAFFISAEALLHDVGVCFIPDLFVVLALDIGINVLGD